MTTNPNTLSNEEAAAILAQMYEEGYSDAVSEALRMGAEAVRAGPFWREQMEALLDIYDDAQEHPPGEGCYVPGAFKNFIEESRALLNAAPQPQGESNGC